MANQLTSTIIGSGLNDATFTKNENQLVPYGLTRVMSPKPVASNCVCATNDFKDKWVTEERDTFLAHARAKPVASDNVLPDHGVLEGIEATCGFCGDLFRPGNVCRMRNLRSLRVS